MSDPDPIRIAAQPESAEQAAQMIAHHKAGAWELVGGAVLGLPSAQGFTLWPCRSASAERGTRSLPSSQAWHSR